MMYITITIVILGLYSFRYTGQLIDQLEHIRTENSRNARTQYELTNDLLSEIKTLNRHLESAVKAVDFQRRDSAERLDTVVQLLSSIQINVAPPKTFSY